jgi:hypothetical protein
MIMPETNEINRDDLWAMLDPKYPTLQAQNREVITRWLDRGDGCAVYEDHNLGSPNAGHRQFVSFGSPAAQLEGPNPPQRLPDIGGVINWAYQLVAVCHGGDNNDSREA